MIRSSNSSQLEMTDPVNDSGTNVDPDKSADVEMPCIQEKMVQRYLICRIEDWEEQCRLTHHNQSLRMGYLLTELNLGGLHMGSLPSGEFFQSLPNLQYLWLQENDLKVLNGIFQATPRLAGLWLGNNRLSSLHHQLRSLHSLETLDLSVNELHDFEDTLQELRSIHTLKELDLSGNAITLSENYESIILCQNPALHFLDRRYVQPGARERAWNVVRMLNRPSLKQIGFGTRCSENGNSKTQVIVPVSTTAKRLPRPNPKLTELLWKWFDSKSSVRIKHLDWATVPRSQERRTNPSRDQAQFTIIKAKF
ncbi:hypothetical protein FBUS_07520 [Fasciolopsis buskii]|uniref:Uncharacterized protein n=1 Tax=Fasciolopsis buskii TaxID=27845 RepID=A0A8E0VGL8_9TREM|nr:hypothetical protein FBUS_07520 [Fasciolopsis buski]